VITLEDKIEELRGSIDNLEIDNAELTEEVEDLKSEVEDLGNGVWDRDRLLDKAYSLIGAAINDLGALGEVPLKDVVDCVNAVVENLRVVLA
jgi:predicted nuclease with TOPRIM domain